MRSKRTGRGRPRHHIARNCCEISVSVSSLDGKSPGHGLGRVTKDDAIARADPALQRVYARLLKVVRAFGPVKEERGERSVLLRSRGGFLGVHPKRDGLDLQIVTDRLIRAARVTKVDRVSARRFHVHVRLAKETDVDDQLLEWLREAYDLMA